MLSLALASVAVVNVWMYSRFTCTWTWTTSISEVAFGSLLEFGHRYPPRMGKANRFLQVAILWVNNPINIDCALSQSLGANQIHHSKYLLRTLARPMIGVTFVSSRT